MNPYLVEELIRERRRELERQGERHRRSARVTKPEPAARVRPASVVHLGAMLIRVGTILEGRPGYATATRSSKPIR